MFHVTSQIKDCGKFLVNMLKGTVPHMLMGSMLSCGALCLQILSKMKLKGTMLDSDTDVSDLDPFATVTDCD